MAKQKKYVPMCERKAEDFLAEAQLDPQSQSDPALMLSEHTVDYLMACDSLYRDLRMRGEDYLHDAATVIMFLANIGIQTVTRLRLMGDVAMPRRIGKGPGEPVLLEGKGPVEKLSDEELAEMAGRTPQNGESADGKVD